ncbi:hypothetical protein E2C01_070259 [Portunus trituberculatus]|uniref:Uncharacterized protein n=1 Tax=Portunus trituberculatus TaxID=210409 RepID=A0A5B7HWT4_PORTR|nr:hypothetical protein [Portunus trituberculatus]
MRLTIEGVKTANDMGCRGESETLVTQQRPAACEAPHWSPRGLISSPCPRPPTPTTHHTFYFTPPHVPNEVKEYLNLARILKHFASPTLSQEALSKLTRVFFKVMQNFTQQTPVLLPPPGSEHIHQSLPVTPLLNGNEVPACMQGEARSWAFSIQQKTLT